MNDVTFVVVVGVGATLLIDAWAAIRKRVFGIPALDYALVGRWLAYLPRGRFLHRPIGSTPPVKGERMTGWIAHYAIGIAFAAVLPAIWGIEWLRDPKILPALVVGIVSAFAPLFVMLPAFGAGIAASRAPRPGVARIRVLVTHGIFGVGLYLAARLLQAFHASGP